MLLHFVAYLVLKTMKRKRFALHKPILEQSQTAHSFTKIDTL